MRYFDNEREFTTWALKQARARGWMGGHLSNMRVVRQKLGIRAIPDKDAAGFPDLVLVHPLRGVLWIELKMPKGRLKPEQVAWLVALRSAGERVYVFYSHQQDDLLAVLDGGRSQALFDDAGKQSSCPADRWCGCGAADACKRDAWLHEQREGVTS